VSVLYEFDDVVVAGDGEARILDGLSARVGDSGVTVILGPSGAGKSTLLRLCNRLEVASSGRVLLRGGDVLGLDPLVLRRRVGMVFQRPSLFPGTVRDNLSVALPAGDEAAFGGALERAGLPRSFLDRRGDDLSGGEAQRACLARTLVTGPEVLLMDEPTSSLDPTATRVLERLAGDVAAGGVPVLWVTHDLDQAERIADHRLVVVAGRVVDDAEAERWLQAERGA
jgi:putative ABC transport system ATP-binding protein